MDIWHLCYHTIAEQCRSELRRHIKDNEKMHTDGLDPHLVCIPCSHAHFDPVTTACVIAKETGLSPLARTCSRAWKFSRRLDIWSLRSLSLPPFKSKKTRPKKLTIMSLKRTGHLLLFYYEFSVPRASLVQNHAYIHNCTCFDSMIILRTRKAAAAITKLFPPDVDAVCLLRPTVPK